LAGARSRPFRHISNVPSLYHLNMPHGLQVDKIRFGVFEADLRAGELRKHGVRIHLQRQPFKILAALIDRPGEVVTREDLRQLIWGPETVVDFDHSLGTAINRLREALSDSADRPQFIETLAKRGFRFIAPVEPIGAPPAAPYKDAAPTPTREDAAPIPLPAPVPFGAPRRWTLALPALAAVVIVVAALWLLLSQRSPTPAPVRFTQITSDYPIYPGQIDIERFPGVATDGVRVYFSDFQNGRVGLAYVLIGGGEVHRFVTPPEISRPSVADISRDGAELLIRSMMWSETEQPVWIAPSTGGSARRLFDVMAHDASWAPDGKAILYASGQDLFLIERASGKFRKFATLSGRAYWMRYAPDGSIIRFTLLDSKTRNTSLWEISSDARNPHPILSGWNTPPEECCGDWTSDESYFVFQSAHNGRPNIWGLREPGFWRRRTAPFEITAGPLEFFAPVSSPRTDQLFAIGANTRAELFHFNLATRKAEPYLSNVRSARRSEHAHHSDRIAWISSKDGTLWRGKADGTDRVQLVGAPWSVYMERWSPDDARMLVMAKLPGSLYKIYTISSDGGSLEPLLDEGRNQADPDWGPGGTAIVFGRLPDYAAEATSPKDILILDLATRKLSVLPESTGMFSPRWSPDGRYIAAMTLDQHRLMVFDRTTSKWSTVVQGVIHNPVWSHDGRQLYFQSLKEDEVPIFRVSVADRRLERICDRSVASSADSITFWGLAPDDGPLASSRFYAADVYGLRWNHAN
jgi:DNA-binding winged helix-turn-helix (wHTH) protein/Tol biopolymer transport system component